MATSSAAAKQILTSVLASPSKIAHALDWKKLTGSVLSLHIGAKTIDLAVTHHPSSFSPIQTLPSIPVEMETRNNRKLMKKSVLLELSDVVEAHKVCGLVVSFPLQREGWCGNMAGKVLHTLDQIVDSTSIVSKSRPVCLWDGHHFHNPEDEWGRLALYSIPSTQKVHKASQEQYQDEGMLAADIAADYLKFHWPEFAHNLDAPPSSTSVIRAGSSLLNTDLRKSASRKKKLAGSF